MIKQENCKPCALCKTSDSVFQYLKVPDREEETIHLLLKCSKCDLVYVDEEIRENKSFISNNESVEELKEIWAEGFLDSLDVYADTAWGEKYQDREDVFDWQYKHILNLLGDKLDISGFSILEMGCARGYLLEKLKKQHPNLNLIGVELSPIMANKARELEVAEIYNCVIEDAPLESNSIDAIVGFGMFIQIRDPMSTMQIFNQVLKPKGRLLLDSPNDLSVFRWLMKFLYDRPNFVKLGRMESRYLNALQLIYNPDRVYYYSPKTFKTLLESSGFILDAVTQRASRFESYGKDGMSKSLKLVMRGISYVESITNRQSWIEIHGHKSEAIK